MSITLAAEDLCVTQPAISRQVRVLEERLGVRLFERGYRAIWFTPEGEQLFAVADSMLSDLQDALGKLMTPRSGTGPWLGSSRLMERA